MIGKLARWVVFGVVFSLAPLIFNYLHLLLKDKEPTIAVIIQDGELFLIISAMCSIALGELIGSGGKFLVAKVIASGVALLLLCVSAFLFVDINDARLALIPYDSGLVSSISLFIFGMAFVACGCCIALSEVRPRNGE